MPEIEPLLLNLDDVRKLLGGLSRSTIRRLVLRGELKAPIRVSPNRIMFRYADIMEYARMQQPAWAVEPQQRCTPHFRSKLPR